MNGKQVRILLVMVVLLGFLCVFPRAGFERTDEQLAQLAEIEELDPASYNVPIREFTLITAVVDPIEILWLENLAIAGTVVVLGGALIFLLRTKPLPVEPVAEEPAPAE